MYAKGVSCNFFSMDMSLVWLVNLYYITDRVYIMVDWKDANAKKVSSFPILRR